MEGIDGSGKTSQVKLLAQRLADRGAGVAVTREPGGTRVGGEIRKLLLNPAYREITARTELLLYAADRAQHMEEIILPALQAGKIVISDRFIDSTLAYQGGGRGMDLDFLKRLNVMAAGDVRPDLVIILDMPPATALGRIKGGRQAVTDRLEREDLQFYHRVRESYLALARQSPERYRVVAGEGALEEIQREVWAYVGKLPGLGL